MEAAARLTAVRLPIWTLLICGVASAVYGVPQLQALLIYDRAAIGDGELWRLVTGNLVHYSASHFLYDVVALLGVGVLIEIQRLRHFAALCLASGALIGLALYLGKPEIRFFGGLSGVVTAAVTFLCLHGLGQTGTWRWLCLGVLVGVVAKIVIEMALGSSLVFGNESQAFIPVPASHAVGAATALLLFLLARRTRRRGR